MSIRNVFVNELGIENHLTLLRKFICEECGRLIRRGERFWEINHFRTPSVFNDGHMHVLCTTCAPSIEKAEAIYITYYNKFLECDCYETHVRRIKEIINLNDSKLQKNVQPNTNVLCPDCSKPMVLKNGVYSCSDCDTHINSDCAKLDEICKNLDMEKLAS